MASPLIQPGFLGRRVEKKHQGSRSSSAGAVGPVKLQGPGFISGACHDGWVFRGLFLAVLKRRLVVFGG